ncbi:MAG: endonuclease/exonuclease/phosphatase family protein [Planctomycetota bacterium]
MNNPLSPQLNSPTDLPKPRQQARSVWALLVTVSTLSLGTPALAQDGPADWINKDNPNDVRVVTYNMFQTSFFGATDTQLTVSRRLIRLHDALDADVWAFQEVFDPRITAEAAELIFNFIDPLPDGQSWQATRGRNQITVSKFDILQNEIPVPGTQRGIATSLIDLPDAAGFTNDLYLLNNHYPAGGGNDPARQVESDAIVAHLEDARTPGGLFTLPVNTALVVLGDLNIVESNDPLDNLINGNIVDTNTFGDGTPPDWDGTPLTDVMPFHNDELLEDYTWRDDTSQFDPGRLDYVLYSDSVLDVANAFILNTVDLTPEELLATGLQPDDILRGALGEGDFDHLPIVVDFTANPTAPVPTPTTGLVMAMGVASLGMRRRRA